MAYVVKKPLDIGGKRRAIGEILKDEEIVSGAVIRSGYVARIDSGLVDLAEGSVKGRDVEDNINLPILSKTGPTVISVAPKSLSEAIRILQLAQNEAVAAIGMLSDPDTARLVSACTGNKTVMGAASRRIAELSGDGGSAGEA